MEACLPLLTKQADSLTHYLQTEALKISPMTCLARTVIGVIQNDKHSCLLVTLPGKPKAVQENLTILTSKGVLQHALA